MLYNKPLQNKVVCNNNYLFGSWFLGSLALLLVWASSPDFSEVCSNLSVQLESWLVAGWSRMASLTCLVVGRSAEGMAATWPMCLIIQQGSSGLLIWWQEFPGEQGSQAAMWKHLHASWFLMSYLPSKSHELRVRAGGTALTVTGQEAWILEGEELLLYLQSICIGNQNIMHEDVHHCGFYSVAIHKCNSMSNMSNKKLWHTGRTIW